MKHFHRRDKAYGVLSWSLHGNRISSKRCCRDGCLNARTCCLAFQLIGAILHGVNFFISNFPCSIPGKFGASCNKYKYVTYLIMDCNLGLSKAETSRVPEVCVLPSTRVSTVEDVSLRLSLRMNALCFELWLANVARRRRDLSLHTSVARFPKSYFAASHFTGPADQSSTNAAFLWRSCRELRAS